MLSCSCFDNQVKRETENPTSSVLRLQLQELRGLGKAFPLTGCLQQRGSVLSSSALREVQPGIKDFTMRASSTPRGAVRLRSFMALQGPCQTDQKCEGHYPKRCSIFSEEYAVSLLSSDSVFHLVWSDTEINFILLNSSSHSAYAPRNGFLCPETSKISVSLGDSAVASVLGH